MTVFEIGKFVRKLHFGSESVFEFRNLYLWVLQERYRSAGVRFWKKSVERGVSPEGFSLNERIYNSIPLGDLIIFEKKNSEFLKLTDKRKVRQLEGIDIRNGTKLHVLPISAFTNVEIEDKDHIANSPVPLARTDLTTRQTKLVEVKA